jgi:fused signal recognition particle receptor
MESVSLLGTLGAWVAAHPVLALLAAAALPFLATVVSELLPKAPALPPQEPTAEALPSASDAERSAAVLEPLPIPAIRPEPVATAEPQPTTEAPAAPVVVPEPAPAAAPEAPPRARLRDRLKLTSDALVGRLGGVLSGRKVDAGVLDELEMLLMSADLGVRSADELLETVRSRASGGDAEAVRELLRESILEKLRKVEPADDAGLALRGSPHVILVLGVNGSGKTTTIGKLAARHVAAGRKVVLGAGDTFRAAASEQLQSWGERVGCEVVAGQGGGDPSAVAFDTVKAAIARGAEVAIVDTAGRLQTKKPLMEELGKLVRVIGKSLDGAPHETLLVLDANTGQNAISQAQLFSEVAGVSGLVLTKLDGTAKGGVIVGLADELGIPVKYVGVGEAVEDLRDFGAEEFVDALFS